MGRLGNGIVGVNGRLADFSAAALLIAALAGVFVFDRMTASTAARETRVGLLNPNLETPPASPKRVAENDDPPAPIPAVEPASEPVVEPAPAKPEARPGLIADKNTINGKLISSALDGRQVGARSALLDRYSGNAITEAAVEDGLAWLARQQMPDGSWSLTGPYTNGGMGNLTVAASAMALLAFQGHGDTHLKGKYSQNVARGWSALLKLQGEDGLFKESGGQPGIGPGAGPAGFGAGPAPPGFGRGAPPPGFGPGAPPPGFAAGSMQSLYAHAQATIALCELYGMTRDPAFREPAVRAVAFAVKAQDSRGGGWRYVPGRDSDTSVTGWFVMALQSARMARLKVPGKTLKRVSEYLDSAQTDGGRRYGYVANRGGFGGMPPEVLARMPEVMRTQIGGSDAVAAEGLLCRQYLGWKQDNPLLVEGISALVKKSPIAYGKQPGQDVYYWYYATQAAHHLEGPIWDEWNKVMREEVPAHQVKTGAEAGSWDPQSDKWGSAGGRLYVTCLSLYMLEVYYRHLPIYSGYAFVPDAEMAMDAEDEPAEETPPVATPKPPRRAARGSASREENQAWPEARSKPSKPAQPKVKSAPTTREDAAATRLKLAKDLFDQGKKEQARQRFAEIVKQYPGTKAAEEAQKLLPP